MDFIPGCGLNLSLPGRTPGDVWFCLPPEPCTAPVPQVELPGRVPSLSLSRQGGSHRQPQPAFCHSPGLHSRSQRGRAALTLRLVSEPLHRLLTHSARPSRGHHHPSLPLTPHRSCGATNNNDSNTDNYLRLRGAWGVTCPGSHSKRVAEQGSESSPLCF